MFQAGQQAGGYEEYHYVVEGDLTTVDSWANLRTFMGETIGPIKFDDKMTRIKKIKVWVSSAGSTVGVAIFGTRFTTSGGALSDEQNFVVAGIGGQLATTPQIQIAPFELETEIPVKGSNKMEVQGNFNVDIGDSRMMVEVIGDNQPASVRMVYVATEGALTAIDTPTPLTSWFGDANIFPFSVFSDAVRIAHVITIAASPSSAVGATTGGIRVSGAIDGRLKNQDFGSGAAGGTLATGGIAGQPATVEPTDLKVQPGNDLSVNANMGSLDIDIAVGACFGIQRPVAA